MKIPEKSRGFLALLTLVLLARGAHAQWLESSVHVLHDSTQGRVGDLFGWTVAGLGDVDADGVPDLAVSAPFTSVARSSSRGRVYALSGGTGTVLWSHTESLTSSILGYALETVDWDGDGRLDVLAGAPFNSSGGRVWVLAGADGTVLATLTGTPGSFGASLAVGGDFDGDGNDDVVVGAPNTDTPAGTNSGRLHVFPRGSTVATLTLDGPQADAELGLGLAFLGDVDGDGRAELVAGRRLGGQLPAFFDGEARVYGHTGAGVALRYVVGGVGMGQNLLGDRIDGGHDVDGDGRGDFLVGDLFRGEVGVFSGRDGARLYTLDGAGEGAAGGFGTGRFVDDLDRDGRAELALGGWTSDTGATRGGRVFLYSGADGALLRTITATTPSLRLGIDARALGDFDGDGRPDLVLGAYGGGSPGPPAGRVLVVSGALSAPANVPLPAELAGDPRLTDSGGDPGTGPLIGSALEVFGLALDCTRSAGGGPVLFFAHTRARPRPHATALGHLWAAGPNVFAVFGAHASDVVAIGGVVPASPALVGLEYTVQGVCGGMPARLSNALTQTIGE